MTVPETPSPWWKRIGPAPAAEWAAVVLVALFYAAFKTWSMWIRAGDEHIYFAMARAVADGAIPYRDFFFAHPPVHLLVPALVFKVFGFSYGLAFWIAPLASLLGGIALWRLVRRFAPPWSAVLAMIFFLFGRTVLQSSSHMTGVNIGLMFLLLGAERLSAGRPRTGGVLLGLSVMTGIYFLPAALGCIACLGIARPRAFVRGAVAFALTGLGIAVLFDLVSSGQFFEQAIWYQQAKTSGTGSGPTFASMKGGELFHNWKLFLGTIVGGFAGVAALFAVGRSPRGQQAHGTLGRLAAAVRDVRGSEEGGPRLKEALEPTAGFVAWLGMVRRRMMAVAAEAPWAALAVVGAAWVALHWAFLATLPLVWRYYFAVVFVGASVASAMLVVAIARPAMAAFRAWRSGSRALVAAPAVFAVVLVLFGAALWRNDLNLGRKYGIWAEDVPAERAQQCREESCSVSCRNNGNVGGTCDPRKGCRCRYGWVDSPAGWVPRWFGSALRSLWWGGDYIEDGRSYSPLENTLWHESRGAPAEDRIVEAADAVRSRACTDDTVFGDSETAPMIANLTGLRVAANVFDTNYQRWLSGFIDARETVAAVEADGVRFLVFRWSSRNAQGKDVYKNGWANDGPVAAFIGDGFERIWPGPGEDPFDFVILDRKNAPDCGER